MVYDSTSSHTPLSKEKDDSYYETDHRDTAAGIGNNIKNFAFNKRTILLAKKMHNWYNMECIIYIDTFGPPRSTKTAKLVR